MARRRRHYTANHKWNFHGQFLTQAAKFSGPATTGGLEPESNWANGEHLFDDSHDLGSGQRRNRTKERVFSNQIFGRYISRQLYRARSFQEHSRSGWFRERDGLGNLRWLPSSNRLGRGTARQGWQLAREGPLRRSDDQEITDRVNEVSWERRFNLGGGESAAGRSVGCAIRNHA